MDVVGAVGAWIEEIVVVKGNVPQKLVDLKHGCLLQTAVRPSCQSPTVSC